MNKETQTTLENNPFYESVVEIEEHIIAKKKFEDRKYDIFHNNDGMLEKRTTESFIAVALLNYTDRKAQSEEEKKAIEKVKEKILASNKRSREKIRDMIESFLRYQEKGVFADEIQISITNVFKLDEKLIAVEITGEATNDYDQKVIISRCLIADKTEKRIIGVLPFLKLERNKTSFWAYTEEDIFEPANKTTANKNNLSELKFETVIPIKNNSFIVFKHSKPTKQDCIPIIQNKYIEKLKTPNTKMQEYLKFVVWNTMANPAVRDDMFPINYEKEFSQIPFVLAKASTVYVKSEKKTPILEIVLQQLQNENKNGIPTKITNKVKIDRGTQLDGQAFVFWENRNMYVYAFLTNQQEKELVPILAILDITNIEKGEIKVNSTQIIEDERAILMMYFTHSYIFTNKQNAERFNDFLLYIAKEMDEKVIEQLLEILEKTLPDTINVVKINGEWHLSFKAKSPSRQTVWNSSKIVESMEEVKKEIKNKLTANRVNLETAINSMTDIPRGFYFTISIDKNSNTHIHNDIVIFTFFNNNIVLKTTIESAIMSYQPIVAVNYLAKKINEKEYHHVYTELQHMERTSKMNGGLYVNQLVKHAMQSYFTIKEIEQQLENQ
ncbi:MAG: hypothetical protein QXP36_03815 [Conexivisphaerales archaeon]